LDQYRSLHAP
jgi:hypothetical protein